MMYGPKRVTVVEVGPRDGFQIEDIFIPTDTKIKVIDALSAAGLPKIEAASFVNPAVVPPMADSVQVMGGIQRRPGAIYSALVPNLRGAQRAIQARVGAMRVVVCASEIYNERNVRMSVAESLTHCETILETGRSSGIPAEVVIGLSFGCPFEGDIPEGRVVALARELANMGYQEISIADTVCLANPAQVRQRMSRLQEELPEIHFSLHLHNTRGLGLANVLAGLEVGIDSFDSSVAGLGGCPVVPGCTGNIPTEDLVNMLHEIGIETGINIQGVLDASRIIQEFLRRPLPSYVLQAGTREQLYRRTSKPEVPASADHFAMRRSRRSAAHSAAAIR